MVEIVREEFQFGIEVDGLGHILVDGEAGESAERGIAGQPLRHTKGVFIQKTLIHLEGGLSRDGREKDGPVLPLVVQTDGGDQVGRGHEGGSHLFVGISVGNLRLHLHQGGAVPMAAQQVAQVGGHFQVVGGLGVDLGLQVALHAVVKVQRVVPGKPVFVVTEKIVACSLDAQCGVTAGRPVQRVVLGEGQQGQAAQGPVMLLHGGVRFGALFIGFDSQVFDFLCKNAGTDPA